MFAPQSVCLPSQLTKRWGSFIRIETLRKLLVMTLTKQCVFVACVCVHVSFSNEGNSEASGPSIWLFRSLSLNLFLVWPDVTACGTLAVHSSLAEEITGHLWSVILD